MSDAHQKEAPLHPAPGQHHSIQMTVTACLGKHSLDRAHRNLVMTSARKELQNNSLGLFQKVKQENSKAAANLALAVLPLPPCERGCRAIPRNRLCSCKCFASRQGTKLEWAPLICCALVSKSKVEAPTRPSLCTCLLKGKPEINAILFSINRRKRGSKEASKGREKNEERGKMIQMFSSHHKHKESRGQPANCSQGNKPSEPILSADPFLRQF